MAHEFLESKSPLTKDNVHKWAIAEFVTDFAELPKHSRLKWVTFQSSPRHSRPLMRSLGRSSHGKLLIIGGYAPGPEILDDEPSDPVVAHVHANESDCSFYRIEKDADGLESYYPVNSTSTVAFHHPFSSVGDDTGGSQAIHRVSALISYYFLAAGHVNTVCRSQDPTFFTRHFRDACAWVANRGERPTGPVSSRRLSGAISLNDGIAVRPKRSSTISSNLHSPVVARSPIMKRAATDDVNVKREKHDDDHFARPRKHPRRTLSEQINIPNIETSLSERNGKAHSPSIPSALSRSGVTSPRSTASSPRYPPQERVHAALQLRIQSLKEEKTTIQQQFEHEQRDHEETKLIANRVHSLEQTFADLQSKLAKMEDLESTVQKLRDELDSTKQRLGRLEKKEVKMISLGLQHPRDL
jgi:FtsZ-binding cell division protein ZapB